ncbi:hypothetical protein D3C81_2160820 [compost metagenome]
MALNTHWVVQTGVQADILLRQQFPLKSVVLAVFLQASLLQKQWDVANRSSKVSSQVQQVLVAALHQLLVARLVL